jgi:hypothetical protein
MDFMVKRVVIIPQVLNGLVEHHPAEFLLLLKTASFYEILELSIKGLKRRKQS